MKKFAVLILIILLNFIFIKDNSFALKNISFTPIKLDYSFKDMNKFIDKDTLRYTYYGRYKISLDNLMYILQDYDEFSNASLEDILKNLDSIPDDVSFQVKKYASTAFNYESFFKILTSKKTSPSGELLNEINKTYSSLENFKSEFKNLALKSTNSNWIFLTCDANKKLSLCTSKQISCPVILKKQIVLCLNTDESFYTDKESYITSFFDYINWDMASKNYNSPIKY